MKKLLPLFMAILSVSTAIGQTQEGNILFELGFSPASGAVGLGGIDGQLAPSTGIQFWTSDGSSFFSLGAEGGYFIMDDLALKAGLGFASFSPDGGDGTSSFLYKLGAKYYINSIIPVQLDFTGSTIEDQDAPVGGGTVETPDPFWLGLQAGYALFLADNLSFEPSLRYSSSLNSDFSDTGVLEFRFGFSFFMN